jgi:Tfp pilus assembly protein PilF
LLAIQENLHTVKHELDSTHEDLKELLFLYKSDREQKLLLEAPEIKDVLVQINDLRKSVVSKFLEKEEFGEELNKFPESKTARKAFEASTKEWLDLTSQMTATEKLLEERKNAIISQKQFFDELDMQTATDRLKIAKELFDRSDFAAIQDVLSDISRDKERTALLNSKNQLTTRLKNLADEDLIFAESASLYLQGAEMVDSAERHYKMSIDTYPAFENHSKYGVFLRRQLRYVEAKEQFSKALTFADSISIKAVQGQLNLSDTHNGLFEFQLALQHVDTAFEILEKLDNNSDEWKLLYGDIICERANLQCKLWESLSSHNVYMEAVELLRGLQSKKAYTFSFLYNISIAEYFIDHDNLLSATEYADLNASLLKHPEFSEREQLVMKANLNKLYAAICDKRNDFGNAERYLQEALKNFEILSVYDPARHLHQLMFANESLAELYIKFDRYEKATTHLKTAMELAERGMSILPKSFIISYSSILDSMSLIYDISNRKMEAIDAQEKSVEALEQYAMEIFSLQPVYLNRVLTLAKLKSDNFQRDEALLLYNKALNWAREVQNVHPNLKNEWIAETLNRAANFHFINSNIQAAKTAIDEAIGLIEVLYDSDSGRYSGKFISTLENALHIYLALKDEKLTAKYQQLWETTMFEIIEKRPENTEEYANAVSALAGYYQRTKRYPEAIKQFERALLLYQQLPPENYSFYESNLAAMYYSYAISLFEVDNQDPFAVEINKRSIDIYENLVKQAPNENIHFLILAWAQLGFIYERGKNFDSALICYRSATDKLLPFFVSHPKATNILFFDSLSLLERCSRRQDKLPEIRSLLLEVIPVVEKQLETSQNEWVAHAFSIYYLQARIENIREDKSSFIEAATKAIELYTNHREKLSNKNEICDWLKSTLLKIS